VCLAIGGLPALTACACLALLALSHSPLINREPQRLVLADDLLLAPGDFPAEWSVTAQVAARPCAAAPLGSGCRAYRTLVRFLHFGRMGDRARQEVQVHLSQTRAASEYQIELGEEFWVDERGTEWQTPDEFDLSDLSAEEAYAACQLYLEVQDCQFIARYDEFIILYETTVIEMDYRAVMTVFRLIDRRAATVLRPPGS
jgi:hypothetical protein